MIPGGLGRGDGFILRRDRPLEWPIACEAWGTVAGRLVHARGSYFGAAWVTDARRGDVVAGPFRSIKDVVRYWHPKKGSPDSERPATGVARRRVE